MRKGFTLIELMVVIGIISTLAAMFFPTFSESRERARSTACRSNLSQLAKAMLQYASDYDGDLPSGSNAYVQKRGICWAGSRGPNYCDPVHGSLYPYVNNTQIFVCPSDPAAGETWCSYGMNDLVSVTQKWASVQYLVADAPDGIASPRAGGLEWYRHPPSKATPMGANVAFCDGHVKYVFQRQMVGGFWILGHGE